MSKNEDKFKGAYDDKKPINIKDVLSKKEWNIKEIEYNDQTGKYEIEAVHDDGREVSIQRNRQYVDNFIKELLDAKREER
jgi:hypothetical protein